MNRGTIFVAIDKDFSPAQVAREVDSLGIEEWVYLGQDSAWARHVESEMPSSARRIQISEQLDRVAWRLRQPYIEWIGQLSKTNSCVEWWGSTLCSKSAYSRMYLRVCLLEVARHLIRERTMGGLLVVLSSPTLLGEVMRLASNALLDNRRISRSDSPDYWRSLASSFRSKLSSLYRVASKVRQRFRSADVRLSSSSIYRRKVLARRGARLPSKFRGDKTVLLFTWVDRRSFRPDGTYRDPYFGPLPEMLKARGYRVAYVARVLSTTPFAEAVAKLVRCGEEFIFPELLLSEQDWAECRRRAEAFSPVMPKDIALEELPVGPLVQEHTTESKGALAEALSYQLLVANAAAAGIRPRQVIFPCEGHGWEQVVTWAVRQYMPGTKIVGYDNVTFSRLVLSMFPARSEYGLRPLPDVIVTNGPSYRNLLIREGMPPDLVRSGCGLRYGYLWEEAKKSGLGNLVTTGLDKRWQILVAASISPSDSVELVAIAVAAFGGDPRYELVIRCHPIVDAKMLRSRLGGLLRHDNVRFADSSSQVILSSVHVLLYTYTIMCYEALAHGVLPIYVRTENSLDLDKLEAFPDVRWVARTPEELKQTVERVLGMSADERRRWEEEAAQVVRSALAPVTPEAISAFLA